MEWMDWPCSIKLHYNNAFYFDESAQFLKQEEETPQIPTRRNVPPVQKSHSET